MESIFFIVIFLLILTAYWALAVFPRQRAYKKQIEYAESLQVGDEVITYGGLIGTITSLDEDTGLAHIQIAKDVEVRILIFALQRPYDPDEIAHNIRQARGMEQ